MDLTDEQFEDLVGAYALDACDPEEAAAMERYAAAHPSAAAELERLRDVAVGLGAAGAVRPPRELRARLVGYAAERVAPLPATDALRGETERFDDLLDTLAATDLDVVTHNGLTVRQLVVHLEAVDRAFLDAAIDPSAPFLGAAEVETMTAVALAARSDDPFAQTRARFRDTRERLVAVGASIAPGRLVGGYRRDDALVIRAFETWTHHEDICRALGRDPGAPQTRVLRTMAELAMHSLPLALAVRGRAQAGRSARVVLTGPGGGEWQVPCSPGEEPGTLADVVLEAPVLDWCRRVADRLTPAALDCRVDGDEALGAELVDAAPAFAGL